MKALFFRYFKVYFFLSRRHTFCLRITEGPKAKIREYSDDCYLRQRNLKIELAFQKKIKLWVSMRAKDFNIFDFGLLLIETVAVKKYEV